MENVFECAKAYQELLRKEYIFTLEGNITFSIYFTTKAFYHILGLEKLTDVEILKGKKPNQIFKQILDGSIPNSALMKSDLYHKIEDRVKKFDDVFDMLDMSKSNEIIVDFDITKVGFDTKLKMTKYILYKRNATDVSHLTLGFSKYLYPETFIVEASNQYLSGQKLLDILNIEIKEYPIKNKTDEVSRV